MAEPGGPPMSWGRCFEDFHVGDHFRHPLGRTITAADNAWFTTLTMNTHQVHFNDHYAAQTSFGRQLVNSTLTLAVVVGLSVVDVSQMAVANLGWDEVRLPHPVFVGDTLYAESIVLATRASASHPDAGIVTVKTHGINQDGKLCIAFRRTMMVFRREAAQSRLHFPTPDEPLLP